MADIIVIAIIGVIAYIWGSRGFFSSFLHMVCCIVAATVAFAVWEPLAYWLMDQTKVGGSTTLLDLAWIIGLIAPFVVPLALTRLAIDKAVPTNLDFDGATNMIGGLACGAVSGFITAGLLVIALGFGPARNPLWTFQPMDFETNGSIVRRSNLLVRADTVTASVFSMLSESTFYPDSGETLARWRPNMADEGPLNRITFPPPNGGGRHTIHPTGFEITGRFQVAPKDSRELLTDTLNPDTRQQYQFLDGTQLGGQARLEGVVIKFGPAAKERTGAVIVGNGQIQMLVENQQTGETRTILPATMISQAQGDRPTLGRWRFNAQQTFISSVGGASESIMVFEFPVPQGFNPIALTVRGVRRDMRSMPAGRTFETVAARDVEIRSGAIAPRMNVSDLVRTGAARVRIDPTDYQAPIRFGNQMPFGMILQKDNVPGITLNEGGFIENGETRLPTPQTQNRGIERVLQVRGIAVGDDTVIMQVTMDETNTQFGLLTPAMERLEDRNFPPVFIDNNGQPYAPIGYCYESTGQESWIRFTPQTPLGSLNDAPLTSISRSLPGNKLVLIYRVSKGVKMTDMVVGRHVVVTFDKPFDTTP
ncbi:MAG: CvpA family protein [Phycisphaeraceae bacterium]|nr:CvpA family protein [Phycisphaeraceae bacterium]